MNDDDVCTILHIIYLSASSGALYGKNAQDITRPPQTVPEDSPIATTSTATSEGKKLDGPAVPRQRQGGDPRAGSSSSEIGKASTSEYDHESHEPLRNRLKKLENDLVDVTQGFRTVSDVTKHASTLFKTLQYQADVLQSVCKDMLLAPGGNTTFSAGQLNACVDRMVDAVSMLKPEMPRAVTLRVQSVSDLINHLLKLPAYQESHVRTAFQDFEKNYMSLDQKSQQCLFCFSAFPAGYDVHKRLLKYWWVGEGLIDIGPQADGGKIAEELANEMVKKFLDFEFVEPITDKGRFAWLRMHPVIRYAVAYLAERANFFAFDFEWNTTPDFQLCQRACLIKSANDTHGQQLIEGHKQFVKAVRLHPEKLRSLLNISCYPVDITGKWFRKMRNVNVLVLVVQNRNEWSIQLPHDKCLKWLKGMKHLRFLFLKNFLMRSNEFFAAIKKLENLRILALNNCKVRFNNYPFGKRSLQRLTHLELNYHQSVDFDSRANLTISSNTLTYVIRELRELQVLKGFHITDDFCMLYDLVGLKKLRKLGIIVWVKDFPLARDLDALWQITSLQKLEIIWKRNIRRMLLGPEPQEELQRSGMILKLPSGLQKLSLRNFPNIEAPDWLLPGSLESLKKLYIREGNLLYLRENDKWKVKILRLINLPEFDMDWSRGTDGFPDLIYLEINECPKLTSFTLDGNGVWLNKRMLTEELLQELGFSWSFLATYKTI